MMERMSLILALNLHCVSSSVHKLENDKTTLGETSGELLYNMLKRSSIIAMVADIVAVSYHVRIIMDKT